MHTVPAGTRDDLRACTAFGAVAEALAEGQNLDRVLHVIAEQLCRLTGRARCSIHLLDAESGLLRGRAAYAPTDIDAGVRRLVSGGPRDGFTREVLTSRQPVALVDALSDPRSVHTAMRRWNARSVLGVPLLLRNEVVGMVCLDDERRPGTFDEPEQRLVSAFANLAATAVKQAQLTDQLRGSLGTVANQVSQLHQASLLEARLTEIVLRGCTLREVADTIAELLGKPCAIYSARLRRLAASDDEARLLDAGVRAIPSVVEVLDRLVSGEPKILPPAPWAGLHHRILVVSIPSRLGFIAIGEHGSRLGLLDEAVARRAATSIALERSGARLAAETEWHTLEAFTGCLLRGDEPPESLEQRADALGVRLDVPRAVCLVAARRAGGGLPPARDLARALTEADSPSAVLGAPSGDDIALVVELPGDLAARQAVTWAKRRLAAALDRLGHPGGLLGAVSSVARAAGEEPRAHLEARQVLACARGHLGARGNAVLTADDLGPGRLLLAAAEPEQAARFGQDTLGPLLGEDAKSRELLATLVAFLDSGQRIRATARALAVHPNTVRYRLARIEKLTALPLLTDPTAHLTAHLAVLTLRLRGTLPLG